MPTGNSVGKRRKKHSLAAKQHPKKPAVRSGPILKVDQKSTLKRAFAQAGLVSDPNTDIKPSRASRDMDDSGVGKLAEEGSGSEPQPSDLQAQMTWVPGAGPKKRTRPAFSQKDRDYIEPLVAKHGTDTAAMVRDIKLNWNQLGEGPLRKLVRLLTSESS